jgi:hypothetical protein
MEEIRRGIPKELRRIRQIPEESRSIASFDHKGVKAKTLQNCREIQESAKVQID